MSYASNFRKTFSGNSSLSPPSFLPSSPVENTASCLSIFNNPPRSPSFLYFLGSLFNYRNFLSLSRFPLLRIRPDYRSKRAQFPTTIYFCYLHSNFRQICGKFQ
ncbi:hypothetical protein Gotur_031658, partial [Gossypium turneri]